MKETVWMGRALAHSMGHSTSHQPNEWDWIINQWMTENCGTQVDITKGAWHLEGIESSPHWDTSYVLKPGKLLKMLSLQFPHLWNGTDYAYLLELLCGSSEDIHWGTVVDGGKLPRFLFGEELAAQLQEHGQNKAFSCPLLQGLPQGQRDASLRSCPFCRTWDNPSLLTEAQ